ncbi:hypothetical protein H6769_04800 [Candidatus Peribacteria bacterium]|nr:hypothetical protein [Candidatus Peribacteria bacterium]
MNALQRKQTSTKLVVNTSSGEEISIVLITQSILLDQKENDGKIGFIHSNELGLIAWTELGHQDIWRMKIPQPEMCIIHGGIQ